MLTSAVQRSTVHGVADEQRWSWLADYNSRIERGIVHSPEFEARMRDEQEAFNREVLGIEQPAAGEPPVSNSAPAGFNWRPDAIGDHRKSEAERRADHLSRCSVCREVKCRLESAGIPVLTLADLGIPEDGPRITDAMADKILAALTTWHCDRCGAEATGGLTLPETWTRVAVGVDRRAGGSLLDLCPACAHSMASWLERVG